MTLKKKKFSPDEIAIFDDAVIYKRGDYWQFRMWLAKEGKYARLSLKTRSQSTAEDKARQRYFELMAQQSQGKTYFSLTTKEAVELYLADRWTDVEAGIIVKGRYSTIKTHLGHWLDFIKKDVKIKELERTDCGNYFHTRTKTKKGIAISQTTVANEQSTINAMMHWLYKKKESHIDGFDFKKLPRIDRGDEVLRRATFTDEELRKIKRELYDYIAEAKKNIDKDGNLAKVVVAYYLIISSMTGLRRGEQLQLTWNDIEPIEHNVGGEDGIDYSLMKIKVRGETSKVRKTRVFVVKDPDSFDELFKLLHPRFVEANKSSGGNKKFAHTLIFSVDGITPITVRAVGYLFDKMIELAEIEGTDKRDLVPYSFRHLFITQRINAGLTPTQVAEMCGTSVTQIEKTYYHTTEAKMISNALTGYYIKDGLLIPT